MQSEASTVREGNLRLAGVIRPGFPSDPLALAGSVRGALSGSGASPYGPTLLWFTLPPEGQPAAAWECVVGSAVTGMGRPGARLPDGERLVIEDYRDLEALTLQHPGPLRDLPGAWSKAAEAAKGRSWRLRPYWRLALRLRRLADGNLLPVAEVAVYADR